MRGFAKMAMASMATSQNPGSNYEGAYNGNYGPENRRDRRGRYAPKYEFEDEYRGNDGGSYRMGHDKGWEVRPLEDIEQTDDRQSEIEDRFRDRRGREHYNNGRYAPMRSEYDNNEPNTRGYETASNVFPIYQPGYNYRKNGSRMIGFAGDGAADTRSVSTMDHYGKKTQGHNLEAMDKQKAREWISSLENSDGSSGEHWSFEQTHQAMKQRNINCDPVEFYATINMLWSDYGSVAKKYGVDNVDFWSELAKSFLEDKDAEAGKLMLYYDCIVKR